MMSNLFWRWWYVGNQFPLRTVMPPFVGVSWYTHDIPNDGGMTIAQKQTLSDLEAKHLGTRTPAEKMKDRTCSWCFHPYYPIEMAIPRYTVLQNWPCDLGGCVQGHGHEQGLQRYYFASCWVANRGAKCEKYRKMLQTVVSSFICVQYEFICFVIYMPCALENERKPGPTQLLPI